MSGRGKIGGTGPGNRRLARHPYSSFWLVVEEGEGRPEALTLGLPDGGEALAVFCHPEEAEMFLWFEAAGRGWRTAEASAPKLASVLLGPRSGVGRVALDPSPAILTGGLLNLVTVGRERFLNRLAGTRPGKTDHKNTTSGGTT